MFKMLTTSLALSAFASLALAQVTVTVTETVLVSNAYTTYTATSQSTYTTDTLASSPVSSPPSSSTSASSPSSTGATTTHSVQVGPSGQLIYNPTNISAGVGDTVEFFFNPKNHTVTQSNFALPCETLEESTGKAGLDSGFSNPTNVSLTTVGFSFVVNDTSPLWFHCAQTGHCKKGMVFAVNANENKTFAAYLNNALNSNASSSSSPSGSSGGLTASATGSGASGASASSTSSPSSGSDAISISVNFGLTAVFAVVGGFILAL